MFLIALTHYPNYTLLKKQEFAMEFASFTKEDFRGKSAF